MLNTAKRLREEKREEKAFGYERQKYFIKLYEGNTNKHNTYTYAESLEGAIGDALIALRYRTYNDAPIVKGISRHNNHRAIIKAIGTMHNGNKFYERELTATVELGEYY